MDNTTFNDCIIEFAAKRMTAQGYAESVKSAKTWLINRGTTPMFIAKNNSFAERGAVTTLERVCAHAYSIVLARRTGSEIELPKRVKAYYTPIFEKKAVTA